MFRFLMEAFTVNQNASNDLIEWKNSAERKPLVLKGDRQVGKTLAQPRYYVTKNNEIDFMIQKGTEIIPIEVKGGEDKSAPSFNQYINQVGPEYGIRFSQRGYLTNGKITNIPLYLVRKLIRLI